MVSTVKPTPIALVVCDNIYTEPGGKTALVGLFNSILAHSFPVRHSRMAVFASLTGLRDGSTAKLEIVNGENEAVIVSAEGQFPGNPSALTVVDMNFIFNNVLFPEQGTYFIRFWANDHILIQRPFHVQQIKIQGGKNDDKS
jgi:hypothetical protein